MPKALPKGSKVKKVKKVQYGFNVKKATEAKVTQIALHEDRVRALSMERRVIGQLLVGRSYEDIASQYGITVTEAFNHTKEVVKRWAGDLCLTANEAKEIEIKRLDAQYELAAKIAYPHPIISEETGMPILDGAGNPILTPPNADGIRLLLAISDRRSKLLGLDAADKLRAQQVDMLTRRYIGVDPNDL